MDIKTEEIEISMSGAVDALYQRYGHLDSAHNFASLFVWREEMQLSIYREEELYAVRSRFRGDDSWFFPVGSGEAIRSFLERLMAVGPFRLVYVTEEDKVFLEKNFPLRFEVNETPEDSEYVYDRVDMTELPGGRFSRKRNYMKKLEREHELAVSEVTSDNLELVQEISEEWFAEDHEACDINDRKAVTSVLEFFDALGTNGIIVSMDGVPSAFVLGYHLDEENVVCCLQKNRRNIHGISYYARKQFAIRQSESVRFLNWEEDLGLQGLRKAKSLMRPCRMINMYSGVYSGE